MYNKGVGRLTHIFGQTTSGRVVLIEGTNFRYFGPGELLSAIDIATVDVSFISLEIILPRVVPCLRKPGIVLALIKPQFELDRKDVGRGGIVRSREKHARAIGRIEHAAEGLGLRVIDVVPSPVKGLKGNQEFFLCLQKP